MLINTFQHIQGIGSKTEWNFWQKGIFSWDQFKAPLPLSLSAAKTGFIESAICESRLHLDNMDATYFAERLPAFLHWRLFPDFQPSAVYLDIETTGLTMDYGSITTIALYDGNLVSYYIKGHNLKDFPQDISKYNMIITYNGKCFDIPYIERYFDIKLPHAQIDLRYVLAGLGYKGGLKACERQLGLDRGDLADVDGAFAVLLWDEYANRSNLAALETLLAYNIADAVNLERLMILALNEQLQATPFESRYYQRAPHPPKNPFQPDVSVINRLKQYCISNQYDSFY